MNKPTIGIVDTKAGNITSLMAAIKRIGLDVRFLKSPELENIDRLVIPGQGRFGTVMDNLKSNGWLVALQHWHEQQKPIFGICVGFQIFFERSEEDPGIDGLGWLKGEIKKLNSPKQPMVGWCKVGANEQAPFDDDMAYFVNSYVLANSPHSIANSQYGQTFCSAIRAEQLSGVQFHPEKSSIYGQEVIAKCLAC